MNSNIENVDNSKRERESSNLKNKNGITLIALIITIVVLLILAGVTIATLTGENGLLSRARTAVEKNAEAEFEENERLEEYAKMMNLSRGDNESSSVDISGLATDIQTLQAFMNNFKVIKCKTPASTRVSTKIADYPEGYTKDNCTVISRKEMMGNGSGYYETDGDSYIYTYEDGIYFYLVGSHINQDMYLVLYKFQ